MPSLRKRVTSYFRQLSFHNEQRDPKRTFNENTFITKYLNGEIRLREGPPILHGKKPTDLPNYEIGDYEIGAESIVGCHSGPHGGLTTVKRQEKHLTVPDCEDIDFIDTATLEEATNSVVPSSPRHQDGQCVDNTTMLIRVAGQEYCVTNRTRRRSRQQHGKSQSLGSLNEFGGGALIIETTKIDPTSNQQTNNNHHLNTKVLDKCVQIKQQSFKLKKNNQTTNDQEHKIGRYTSTSLAKSKSEGDPFRHKQNKKHGKLIKLTERPTIDETESKSSTSKHQWHKTNDHVYGISSSLYDENQVTHHKNGNPIADCFGIIARTNSAIIAVADGVNWGEKAAIAAKSAIHGSIYYLNKTIFNDTQTFDNLLMQPIEMFQQTSKIKNTKDVFVGLLRAFNCAHDLILENDGMLTTLTVAVVLPLKRRRDDTIRYVCCVCNVGDTLAYVYSRKYGIRELTKGSHDVSLNRDMRDALGALGPVDGINPELSNLTLSITTLNKGDIVLVASDGLTDNFDPNVCRFTVEKKPAVGAASSASKPPPPPRQVHHTSGRQLQRSKTSIDEKRHTTRRRPAVDRLVSRNSDGLAFVTPMQRYELQLLLLEDLLIKGISGREEPCATAKQLCESLVDFTINITAAKRRTLEDKELYFNQQNDDEGIWVEVSQQEQKMRRKKALERAQMLPGKLDHVTVAAWTVANVIQ